MERSLSPPQKMSYDNFPRWVVKQKSQAKEVFSCSEAGPTGYWLHRKLIEIGIVNYVVGPTCLDVRRSGVNNDKSDALELATCLDRYLAGNHKYFSIRSFGISQRVSKHPFTRTTRDLPRFNFGR